MFSGNFLIRNKIESPQKQGTDWLTVTVKVQVMVPWKGFWADAAAVYFWPSLIQEDYTCKYHTCKNSDDTDLVNE